MTGSSHNMNPRGARLGVRFTMQGEEANVHDFTPSHEISGSHR